MKQTAKTLSRTYSFGLAFYLLAALIASFPGSKADGIPEKRNQLREALYLMREGEADKAKDKLIQELARYKADSSHALRLRYYLAKIKLQEDQDAGKKELESVLAAQEKLLGSTHPDTIQSYRTLASAYKESNGERSGELLVRALEADKTLFGKNNLRIQRTGQLLDNSAGSEIGKDGSAIASIIGQQPLVLARVHLRQGIREFNEEQFASAIPELKQTREMLLKLHGENSRELAEVLYFLGISQRIEKDLPAARDNLQKSARIYAKTGQKHEESKCLRELALVQALLGNYEDADKSIRESLNICFAEKNDPLLLASLLESARVLAELRLKTGRLQSGINDLTELAEKCRNEKLERISGSILFLRAYLEFADRKITEAENTLAQAFRLVPKNPQRGVFEGKFVKALIATDRKNYQYALSTINTIYTSVDALRLRDLQARLLLLRSHIMQSTEKNKECDADLELSLKYARIAGNKFLIGELTRIIDSRNTANSTQEASSVK